MSPFKSVEFLGSSLDDLRAFPPSAKREAGHQIDQVQNGFEPDDWKPMNTVGQGVREIRVRDSGGFQGHLHRQVRRCRLCDPLLSEKDAENQQGGYRSGLETLSRPIAGTKQMSNQRFASIWDAIEDTQEVAENMKLRSTLMTALRHHIVHAKMSQAEAAKIFGVTQPRVSDLMRGKINVFGLDALVNMAAAAGLHIEMRILEPA